MGFTNKKYYDTEPVFQELPPANLSSIPDYFPYRLRDNFLTPAEFNFFKVLESVVGDKAFICIKVSLNDIFWVQTNNNSEFRTYTNKIDRKHVDFLICAPTTMQPIVGIELDDKSHQCQDRQERDVFVDEVFQAAELLLLHILVRYSYLADELSALLASYFDPHPVGVIKSVAHTKIGENQRCSKCGSDMI